MTQRIWSGAKCLLIALAVTVIAYIPSLFSYFQQDDWAHLLNVTSPGHNPWSFSNWFYRPLFLATFGGLYKVFGLNAVGWHIVELLLHLVNVALVYWLIKRLRFNEIAAMVGAAAFGVFPISTNAAAWLSAISGIAATTLCLIAVHISLSRNIPALLRGILCFAVWTPALFFKEEAASMIVVFPFLPLFTKEKSRREWAIWFSSCLLMVGALAFFVHMEGQCQHVLGNPDARVSLELLRRAATFVLWPTSMGPPVFDASKVWMPAVLALVPVALWRLFPTLRPGLFWLISTGMAIGIALKYLAPAGRYFYIPSIGICLCVSAFVHRISRPMPFAARFIATLLVVWIVSIGNPPPTVAIAAGLIVLIWNFAPDRKDNLDRITAITALGAASVFSVLEYLSVTLTSIGYFPIWLNLTMPLLLAGLFIVCNYFCGRPLRWSESILFFSLAFWTRHPAALVFLIGLILAPFVFKRRTNTISMKPIIAGLLIVLPWGCLSMSNNMTRLESGQKIRTAVSKTSYMMKRLPKGSDVVFVDQAGLTSPESKILQVISRINAGRPDLRVRRRSTADHDSYTIVCDNRWEVKLYPPK